MNGGYVTPDFVNFMQGVLCECLVGEAYLPTAVHVNQARHEQMDSTGAQGSNNFDLYYKYGYLGPTGVVGNLKKQFQAYPIRHRMGIDARRLLHHLRIQKSSPD